MDELQEGQIWQCREPIWVVLIETASDGGWMGTVYEASDTGFNNPQHQQWYTPARFKSGHYRINDHSTSEFDLAMVRRKIEIGECELPSIKVGQIWQCRGQSKVAYIIRSYVDDADGSTHYVILTYCMNHDDRWMLDETEEDDRSYLAGIEDDPAALKAARQFGRPEDEWHINPNFGSRAYWNIFKHRVHHNDLAVLLYDPESVYA